MASELKPLGKKGQALAERWRYKMSQRVELNAPAPDFELDDLNGNPIQLSSFFGQKNIVLIFNRGFKWPYCRAHMAQLRRDYEQFQNKNAEILVVGPENAKAFKSYWQKENLPYPGLPDPKHHVLKLYGQQIKIFKFGRMPAQSLIDKKGIVRYIHYGHDMTDIPKNEELLQLIDTLNAANDE